MIGRRRRGDHAITLEQGGTVVAKAFPPGPDGERRAATELERLQLMHDALRRVDGVTCPRPLAVRHDPHPVLTMAFVDGVPMTQRLASRSGDREHLARLSRLLVDAVDVHVSVVGEPVADLHFRNMLHDPGTDDVVLLDLGEPAGVGPRRGNEPPGDAVSMRATSVSRLVGSTLFECARPQHVVRLRANLVTARAARATLLEAARRGGDVEDIAEGAERVYAGLTRGRGALRRVWYGTVGAVLAMGYRRVLVPSVQER